MDKNLKKIFIGLAAFALPFVNAYASDDGPPLRLVQKISLPGVQGRIDHMAVDTKNSRLFIAALGNNSLEVVDLKTGRVTQSIKGLKEPQGIAFLPELDKIFLTNGGDGRCIVYDSRSLNVLASIRLKQDADNIRYDDSTKQVYIGYGRGAIGIVDAAANQHTGDIPLEGHPESFQLENSGNRIYANVPSARHIAVIDRRTKSVIQKWPVKGLNFPMALDEPRHTLMIVTRQPSRLLIMDTLSGRTISDLNCVADADDVFYDAARRRIYVSGGEGFVDVFSQDDKGKYQHFSRIPTAPGGRTSSWVPELKYLFVAVPAGPQGGAAVLVFQASGP